MTDDKLQLLVVDDDEDDYLLVRDLLKSGIGADVERAASADQALERSQTSNYDAMLLDYRLGARSGLEVLRELRQRDVASPVIFLTGHGDEALAVEAMKAGATDYLPKSRLNMPALAMAVRYAVNLRHKEEAVQAARRALQASEQRFRALVENGSDIITLIDAEGTILYSSQSARRIVGWAAEEIMDGSAFQHVHPDDQPRLRDLFQRVLQAPGVPIRFEHRSLHQDGHYVVLESTAVNRLQDDAVSAVVINSRDVSQRCRAEEALRQSERDYRTLFENANDAIMIFEPVEENILEVNPKACEMYGFSRREMLGKSLRELTADVDHGRQGIEMCLAQGWIRDFETVHHRRNGTPIYILANASVIAYRGHKAILTLSRDVSERRAAQQEIYRLNRALKALSKCNQALLHATDREQLLREICEIVVEFGAYRMAWVAVPKDDQTADVVPIACAGDAEDYLKLVTGLSQQQRERLPVATSLRTGKPDTSRDIANDERFAPFREECARRGFGSMISLPLNLAGRRFGALAMYASERDAFDAPEVELLSELAANVSYGLNALHTQAERERAEKELRDSEHRLRNLIETANEGIWTFDDRERTTFVNRKMAAMLGYSPEEMLAHEVLEFMPPEENERAKNSIRERSHARGQYETVLLRKDGTKICADLNISPLLDSSGNYRGSLAMISDITERRMAEEALRASEQRYRSLAIATAQIVWTMNAQGEASGDASKWGDFTGQTVAQMRGWGWLDAVHPEDRERVEQARGQGLSRVEPYETEYRLRRHDGEYRHISERGVPVIAPASGAVREWVGACTDITDRRNLQEQLLHSQKIEAVGQLAGGVAHDFNNLLMVIGSQAELLHDSTTDATAQRKADEILEGVRRGSRLTCQLLAFSRKQVLSPRVLNLNDTVAELGATLPRMLGEKVHVELRPSPELWVVKADPAQIEQVMINLAVNARDAMPNGGCLTLETSNVELTGDYARSHAGVQPGSYVMLAVSDTGEGIPREVLPHIFEPFFTTKEPGRGTGLGLSTVYGIVQQSGGFVWVYSEVGQGTAFKIYLPKVESPPPQPCTALAPGAAPRGAETILLVEDEEAVRDAVGEFLSLRGYRVLQASNGEEALRLAGSYADQIHLVISDVVMPGISGSEMARQLQAMRPQVRVLFVSGYTTSTVGQHGIDASAKFLQKPFSLSALASKIRELLAPDGR